ncbi:MAG: hypothetical protein AAF626_04045 [Pseudomonadota bacterium]
MRHAPILSVIGLAVIVALAVAVPRAAPAADLSAVFREGAPKDRFTFTALSGCLTGPLEITLDLSSSAAGLIFDTTPSGAGVQVFQPFEIVAGADRVVSVSDVADGDRTLILSLAKLPEGEAVSFTIDIDDTMGGREITVEGAEIAGARVVLRVDSTDAGALTAEATFDADAEAIVTLPASCP